MRKFKCRPFQDLEVDLDDPKTYKHLPQTCRKLDDFMFQNIGYALCYMNIWHKDIFGKCDGGQKKRVLQLINNFCENRRHNYKNKKWLQEQVFMFQDEIENMC